MARQRYVVTAGDKAAVISYIERKLSLEPNWLESDGGKRSFARAKRDTVRIQKWCDKCLSDEQWRQLKDAVRAARKRKHDRTGDRVPKVNITLSRRAWSMLRALAERDGVTLSEFIEKRFEKEWLKMR